MGRTDRLPNLLIIGHARHGKDTVAEMLRDRCGLTFQSSSMELAEKAARPYMAERGITYATLEDCFEDRVNHRALWREALSAYNRPDLTRLTKGILTRHNIYVGLRTAEEYRAARHLFDAVIWVDALRRLPPEGRDSFDIDLDSTMFVIDNNGPIESLWPNTRLVLGQIIDDGK